MTRKSSPITPTFKQENAPPNKGVDNLLKRFLLVRKISLLVLLIAIALLLAFILTFSFINSLNSLNEFALFALVLLPIAIPLAFMIIRLIYRRLKDTDIPLYMITMVSILPVAGAIYLDYIINNDGFFYFFITFIDIFVALNVFALALFLTGLGHLCYQIAIITKYRQQISASMFASTAVATIIVILLAIITVIVMMRVAKGEDFLLVFFKAIAEIIPIR